MGKLPAIIVAGILLWVCWNVLRYGPQETFGGLYDLVSSPQYGEADRPTRSSEKADQILEE